jgi:hypothetical protein
MRRIGMVRVDGFDLARQALQFGQLDTVHGVVALEQVADQRGGLAGIGDGLGLHLASVMGQDAEIIFTKNESNIDLEQVNRKDLAGGRLVSRRWPTPSVRAISRRAG